MEALSDNPKIGDIVIKYRDLGINNIIKVGDKAEVLDNSNQTDLYLRVLNEEYGTVSSRLYWRILIDEE